MYFQTTAARSHVASREYYEGAADRLLRRVRPWLPKDRNACCIDLACGCGEMLYLLTREGFQDLAGVDLCQEELDNAKQHVHARFIHSNILDYLKQAESKSVDYLSAFNILEHLSKDSLLTVLTEAQRVLRPGGTLVAMVPNAISPFGSVTRHWDITHEWAFTPNNFQQLAALTGFDSKIEFRECGPVVHGVISGVRWVMWQCLRACIAAWFLIELGNAKGGVYTMDMLVRLRIPD